MKFCVKHGDGDKEEGPGSWLLLSISQWGLLFIRINWLEQVTLRTPDILHFFKDFFYF